MKLTDNIIVGLPVRVVRDLRLHFRNYVASEETGEVVVAIQIEGAQTDAG